MKILNEALSNNLYEVSISDGFESAENYFFTVESLLKSKVSSLFNKMKSTSWMKNFSLKIFQHVLNPLESEKWNRSEMVRLVCTIKDEKSKEEFMSKNL